MSCTEGFYLGYLIACAGASSPIWVSEVSLATLHTPK